MVLLPFVPSKHMALIVPSNKNIRVDNNKEVAFVECRLYVRNCMTCYMHTNSFNPYIATTLQGSITLPCFTKQETEAQRP